MAQGWWTAKSKPHHCMIWKHPPPSSHVPCCNARDATPFIQFGRFRSRSRSRSRQQAPAAEMAGSGRLEPAHPCMHRACCLAAAVSGKLAGRVVSAWEHGVQRLTDTACRPSGTVWLLAACISCTLTVPCKPARACNSERTHHRHPCMRDERQWAADASKQGNRSGALKEKEKPCSCARTARGRLLATTPAPTYVPTYHISRVG